jgi:hypothetical protein
MAATAVAAVLRPRPRLRVLARFYDPGFRNIVIPTPLSNPDQHPICIEVTNIGRRAVTVREVGFLMKPPVQTPVGAVSFMKVSDRQLPACLQPGETHTTFGPASKLPLAQFRRVIAKDTEGRTWRSRAAALPN